jgi:hypothetical protein
MMSRPPTKPPAAATGWSFGVSSIFSKVTAFIGASAKNGDNEQTEKTTRTATKRKHSTTSSTVDLGLSVVGEDVFYSAYSDNEFDTNTETATAKNTATGPSTSIDTSPGASLTEASTSTSTAASSDVYLIKRRPYVRPKPTLASYDAAYYAALPITLNNLQGSPRTTKSKPLPSVWKHGQSVQRTPEQLRLWEEAKASSPQPPTKKKNEPATQCRDNSVSAISTAGLGAG